MADRPLGFGSACLISGGGQPPRPFTGHFLMIVILLHPHLMIRLEIKHFDTLEVFGAASRTWLDLVPPPRTLRLARL